PLSALDAKLRVRTRAELRSLLDRLGTTTLYVTHDQSEAMSMGDRVAVLDRGRLQQLGDPLDLYERPANAFVAGFVGSPPMNLLPAHVEAGDNGGLTVRIGEQRIGVGARAIGRYPQVRQRVGTSIIVGIRPEQLHLPDPSTPDDRRLSGEVVVAEALGSEHVVHLTLATSGADDEVAGGVLADVRHAREVTAVEGGRESSSGSAGSRRPSRAHASSSPWPTTACTSSTP
ncbi:MAG: TOBE domain-containing protein, partial [Acidimicrobiales bacterium]